MSRSRTALLVALGVDNLGSGLFLPLALVYATTVVGLPLPQAGVLVSVGTAVGLLAPPVAGRLVDRVGPRAVVIASQVLQAVGMLTYLVAGGPAAVLLAAALVAAGTQTFYSSLFALIADVADPGPTDRAFARVDVVRTAAFGAGALASALLLGVAPLEAPGAGAGPVLRACLGVDAASCALAAVLLAALVRPRPHAASEPSEPSEPSDLFEPSELFEPSGAAGARRPPSTAVRHNRPYLALILVTGLLGLAPDLFLLGVPVLARREPGTPHWLPGVALALLTATTSALATTVVHRTRAWTRTRAMAAGAACFAAWGGGVAVLTRLPSAWSAPGLLASTLLLAAGSMLFGARANALAEAAAPPRSRGAHLAAFQYAFTAASLIAPLLVSLLAVAAWMPWALASAASLVGLVCLRPLARALPAAAVRPAPAPAPQPSPGAGAGAVSGVL